jgi:hypothetical protein
MNRLASRLLKIALFGNMHSARFLLALAELIWFITLAWPGDTFDRPTYSVMSQIAPEMVWAAMFLTAACFQWSILLSGTYHGRVAVAFAFWNSLLWWTVVLSMYMSVTPPPAAISGELALAFGATWVFVRSGYRTGGLRADDA